MRTEWNADSLQGEMTSAELVSAEDSREPKGPGRVHRGEVAPEEARALSLNHKLVCAVYDKTAKELFGQLIVVRTEGEAIRLFCDAVKHQLPDGQKSPLNMHPDEFCLVRLGFVDTVTCSLTRSYQVLIEGGQVG